MKRRSLSRERWKFPKEYGASAKRLRECVLDGRPTWTVSPDGGSITCHGCKRASYCEEDVKFRFCPCADMFHDHIKVTIEEENEVQGPDSGMADSRLRFAYNIALAVTCVCFSALIYGGIFYRDNMVLMCVLVLLSIIGINASDRYASDAFKHHAESVRREERRRRRKIEENV